MRFPLILALISTALLFGGCASNYSPRADLSSVHTIGVVVPSESSGPREANDVIQLYNLTETEDRFRNSAVGAGTGAGVGSAAGVGAGALIGCSAGGPIAPFCWGVVIAAGALVGGTTGAIAGAVVDTELEQVDTAPVHLYEVNRVMPDLTQDYLASRVLQERALQAANELDTDINFVPATWKAERYVPDEASITASSATDINLVLTSMSVSLNGKAENDPNVRLNVSMQWVLTKYNPETQKDEAWDAMTASYRSEQHTLSEWLTDSGAQLMAEVDTGIQHSLTNAFSDLPGMAQR
jgi:hypothetical protein